MRIALLALLVCISAVCGRAQTEVGSGAPNDVVRQLFLIAFNRGDFRNLVSLPPSGDIKKLGPTGIVQEFPDAAKTQNVRLALVRSHTAPTFNAEVNDVLQVQATMYAFYSSVGVNTAGYPTTDTLACPAVQGNGCLYQLFDRNYALFVYQRVLADGATLSVKDTFFTRWTSLGGLNALGSPITAEQTGTSVRGTTASFQGFSNGAFYNITSGPSNGRSVTIRQPVYDLFLSSGGHTGFLGFPVGDEILVPDGRRRQTFEGGSVEYAPGERPILRLPVSEVLTSPSGTLRMNLGETLSVQARLRAPDGSALEGREVVWTTSNSRAVRIEPAGATAVLRAAGGGAASVTAVSEGRSSPPISIFVTAPCCQVGEGAPTAAIQTAFQDAVSRNNLSIRVPAANPVRRIGQGYMQEFVGAESNPSARFLIAKPDQSSVALVVTGDILAAYQALQGPAGPVGYPLADATAGGRQLFENGALAGRPPVRVAGPILARWAAMGYESGAAGLPAAEAASVLTFTATEGWFQGFAQGAIYAAVSGPQSGRAFFVSGLILAKYNALGGPAGKLGLPVSEEGPVNGKRRQNFEGGAVEYAPGDAEAAVVEGERHPRVSATPGEVSAGGKVRIAVSGFSDASTLRISLSGQPDFTVTTPNGAHAWEVVVPRSASSVTVIIRASETGGQASAEGRYVIRSAAETQFRLAKVRGDNQTGLPGGVLPLPLQISLKDEAGNPVAGAAVRFAASPGGAIEGASAVTDAKGEAQAFLRLPALDGLALATAEAGRQVVTFNARVAASSLSNFPRLTQDVNLPLANGPETIARKGALLAASASILRYYQDRGQLVTSNGFAEPSLLNSFLRDVCVFDPAGAQICDGFIPAPGSTEPVVNLWRLGAFVAGNLEVRPVRGAPEALRDLLAREIPALLALSLTADGAPAGSHFVVAIGVAQGGGILIHDPNPALGRQALDEYSSGFTAGSRQWKGVLASAVALTPGSPPPAGFLLAGGDVSLEVSSAAGSCGETVGWPDVGATGDGPLAQPPGAIRFRYCDGTQPVYQLDLGGSQAAGGAVLTSLGAVGARSRLSAGGQAAFELRRPAVHWEAVPLRAAFSASSVVNAASLRPGVAPGGLLSIFGSGFGPGATVEIGGLPSAVLASTAFQINTQAPAELLPGSHLVRVRSPHGVAEQTVAFQAVAPAIFLLAGGQGAILNQNGSVNGPENPARRGEAVVVFGTGFGAVSPQGELQVTREPVSAFIEGRQVSVLFSGWTPGFLGLYQMNLDLTPTTAPGANLRLHLRQGGVESNAALVSIQ